MLLGYVATIIRIAYTKKYTVYTTTYNLIKQVVFLLKPTTSLLPNSNGVQERSAASR